MRDDLESIAGVDGCRGGWLVARDGGVELITALTTLLERFALIGIDMPIGLPDGGGRAADRDARRFLGTRRSTVFSVPPRAVLAHTTYAAANAACRRSYGHGLTVQCFNLFPKMREVDALAADVARDRVVEIHPECAFARMAGAPLPPKRTAEGRQLRSALVRTLVGIDVDGVRVRGAAAHDVLDACGVLWSARRFAAGTAVTFGDDAVDARGLPMRIVS